MKRLNGLDAMFLYSETPDIHTHTLKIFVQDVSEVHGGYSFERFRRHFYERLLAIPALRYQLVEIPFRMHHPMWLEDADIDHDYHFQRVELPAPGGRRELDNLIGDIAGTALDRRRPLWTMHVAEGLAGQRIAVILKVHHALADGIASTNMIVELLSPDAVVPAHPCAGELRDGGLKLRSGALLQAAVRDHARQLRQLPRLIKATGVGIMHLRRGARRHSEHTGLPTVKRPPATFLNHTLSPMRRFATAPIALADVRQTAKHLGVTINDLVLATASGALRSLLLRYDTSAESPLIVGVPVSFDNSEDRLSGNAFGFLTPRLPVHVDDPIERVRLTKLATNVAKERHKLLGPTVVASWLSYMPPPFAPSAFRRQARRTDSAKTMNLVISNVRGPRERGTVEGARITEIYSVGPLVVGSGMNITVWSYADQVSISVLTDVLTLRDPHEVTDLMVNALIEIREAAGLSVDLQPVEDALPLATS